MNNFSFSGSSRRCDNPNPHPPHRTGEYRTTGGMLENFCPGQEGKVGEGEYLHIHTEKFRLGDPSTPSSMDGWWEINGERFQSLGEATSIGIKRELEMNLKLSFGPLLTYGGDEGKYIFFISEDKRVEIGFDEGRWYPYLIIDDGEEMVVHHWCPFADVGREYRKNFLLKISNLLKKKKTRRKEV